MESYLVAQLFTACTRGDLESVKRLRVSPFIRDNQGNTLFHLCCSSVQCGLDVLRYLITVSNSVNYNYLVNNEQQTLLHLACHSGKLDFAEYLFNYHFGSFTSLDIYRHTPLYYACSSRHYNIVSFICNNVTVLSPDIIYESVKISTWKIMVPLLKKISFKDFMVRVIQDQHVDLAKLVTKDKVIQWLDVKTPFPLHYFATSHFKIVDFLVQKVLLNVNNFDDNHCTPLHIACIKNKDDIVHFLTSNKNCDVEVKKGDDGNRPLHLACQHGRVDLVKHLVEVAGCDINAKGQYERSCLHFACLNRQSGTKVVQFLFSKQEWNLEETDTNSSKPFDLALKHCKVDLVKYLVEVAGCDINAKYQYESSYLHTAFWNEIDSDDGHDIVKFLSSKQECDVEVVDEDGNRILHLACQHSNVDLVKHLVEVAGCDINAKGQYERSSLHIACSNRQSGTEIVQFLFLKQDWYVEAADKNNNRPLHIACQHSNVDLVEHLVEVAGCDINAKGQYERSGLHFACLNQQSGTKVVQFLFSKHEWNFEEADTNGSKPLDLALEDCKVDLVKYLVEVAGCDVNAKDQYESSYLHTAFWNEIDYDDGYDIVKFLTLKQECDVEVVDEDGNRILHLACRRGSVDLVKYLVEVVGCDINAKGQHEKSCLHLAFWNTIEYNDDYDIIKFLFSKQECDVEVIDEDGNQILHLACQHGSVGLVKHLVEVAGCDINAKGQHEKSCLHLAFWNTIDYNDDYDIIKFLTSKQECDVEVVDEDGNRILHLACQHGSVDLVKHLVEVAGCDINAKGQHEKNCLHLAFRNTIDYNDDYDIIKFLSSKQECDVEVVDEDGNRILHLACQHGSVDLVKHLVEVAGCDINAKYQYESSYLHTAFWNEIDSDDGHDIVKFLSSKQECDVEVVDEDGNRILHLACQHGSVDLVKHLVEVAGCDINAKYQYESSYLHTAFWNEIDSDDGHDIVKFLSSKQECDVEVVDEDVIEYFI